MQIKLKIKLRMRQALKHS